MFYCCKLNNSNALFSQSFNVYVGKTSVKLRQIIVMYHFVFTSLFNTPQHVEIERLHCILLNCRLKHLTRYIADLNLSCNALCQLPLELGLCQNLQYLDLQKNLLVDLPQSFECLTRLRELVIAFNK